MPGDTGALHLVCGGQMLTDSPNKLWYICRLSLVVMGMLSVRLKLNHLSEKHLKGSGFGSDRTLIGALYL